jgi:hypothetical protein
VLVLDARPSARVLEIADAEGESVLGGAEVYTPLRLDLPPGAYRMTLRGPGGRTVEATFQVISSRTVTRVEDFGAVELELLWERLGWGTETESAEEGRP